MISENRSGLDAQPVRRAGAGGDDRAAHDLREHGRRRGRAHAGGLGVRRRSAGMSEPRHGRRARRGAARRAARRRADRRGRLARCPRRRDPRARRRVGVGQDDDGACAARVRACRQPHRRRERRGRRQRAHGPGRGGAVARCAGGSSPSCRRTRPRRSIRRCVSATRSPTCYARTGPARGRRRRAGGAAAGRAARPTAPSRAATRTSSRAASSSA